MGNVEPWGMNFLETIADAGPSDQLVAGWLVGTVAEGALVGGILALAIVGLARARIRRIDKLPLRKQLSDLLKHSDPSSPRWPRKVAPELMVYGIGLFHEGLYQAARDIFGIVADSKYLDPDTRLWGMERRAMAARDGGHFVFASLAYLEMERQALEWGNSRRALRARIGAGNVAIAVKDFDEAETILTATLAAAERCADQDAIMRCRANLGTIAGKREDYPTCYTHSVAVMDRLPTEAARTRARLNAAESLARMNRPEDARPLVLAILQTTRETAVRGEAEELLSRLGPAPAVLEPATAQDLEELVPIGAVLSRMAGA